LSKFRLSARQLDESEEWKKKIVTPRVAAVGVVESPDKTKLLVIKRKYPPYGLAFPGGMMELGETIEETAIREVYEETGIEGKPVGILNIISDPESDPRWHVVIIHVVMETNSNIEPKGNDDALSASWENIDSKELPSKLIKTCRSTLVDYIQWKKERGKLMDLR
jgi:8-oxo-dGTP diphosphatase